MSNGRASAGSYSPRVVRINPGNRPALVRLIPDLSAAALKAKLTKELAMWHCLRALNHTGSGSINYDRAIDQLQTTFGYSRRTAFRHLNMGEGLFWQRIVQKRGSTIKIYGLEAVCLYLDTTLKHSKRFYEVPADRFMDPKARKCRLWESVHLHKPKGVKANPVSRAVIANITGVNGRQQRRYDRASDIRRTANFCPQAEKPRMANSYHHKQLAGTKGMLRKVGKQLRFLLTEEAKLTYSRRYFACSMNSILKAKNREDIIYRLLPTHKRKIRGRLEWEGVLLPVA